MYPVWDSWEIQHAGSWPLEAAECYILGWYSLAPRVQLVQARAALDAALVPVALNGTHEDDLQRSRGRGEVTERAYRAPGESNAVGMWVQGSKDSSAIESWSPYMQQTLERRAAWGQEQPGRHNAGSFLDIA